MRAFVLYWYKDVYRACLSAVADMGRSLALILNQAGAGEGKSVLPLTASREVAARCLEEALP